MNKIKRGNGFRGALNYVFERDTPGAIPGRLLGGNMLGLSPRELTAEFAVTKKLRADIKKPVWHNSLRLPAGEKISDQEWRDIADAYMAQMGFNDSHLRCYVLHDDEDGQHIHILASRIDLNGEVYLGQNENLKSTRIISGLERRFGLTITKGADAPFELDGKKKKPLRAPTRNEQKSAARTGEESTRKRLQRLLGQALEDGQNLAGFAMALERAGVRIRLNASRTTGAVHGLSFELDGVAFKGSALGDKFAWSKLSAALRVTDEDEPVLRALRDELPIPVPATPFKREVFPMTENCIFFDDDSRDEATQAPSKPALVSDWHTGSGSRGRNSRNDGRPWLQIPGWHSEKVPGLGIRYWNDADQTFVDRGKAIVAESRFDEDMVKAMLKAALHSFQDRETGQCRPLKVSGSAEFVAMAKAIAAQQGISLEGAPSVKPPVTSLPAATTRRLPVP